ncbi:hypothetical protein EXIGLDRAFT_835166 [Exidia glandulosa HHB12029]|uniref:Uncharacterized protein n=1 Tax=Exidia glandulosa HHB12029 TaxID=1314781 RepID=A0A165J1N7_EXIGL|nr:hypothetical protein EXIGLDRAFT_835166 [Exidia glandulosa HHB12029]
MAEAIDDPPFRLWPELTKAANIRDPYGQFVCLAIDPVASVAVLDDEQARQEAASLPRTRFLALVFSVGDIPRQNAERLYLLNLEFYLIGRGLPDEYPEETVPIFPAKEHPTNRAPLHLTPPLPWADLYVHTRRNFCALVSRIHPGSVAYPTNASDVMRRDIMRYTWNDLKRAVVPLQRPRVVPVQVEHDDDVRSQSLGSSGSAISETDSVQKAYRVITEKAALVAKHVEIWMDLSSCPDPDTLGDPVELFSILEQLQGVWERWESRALAALQDNRSETSAWAHEVANAIVPQLTEVVGEDDVQSDTDHHEHEMTAAPPPEVTASPSKARDSKATSKVRLPRRVANAARAMFTRFKAFIGRK